MRMGLLLFSLSSASLRGTTSETARVKSSFLSMTGSVANAHTERNSHYACAIGYCFFYKTFYDNCMVSEEPRGRPSREEESMHHEYRESIAVPFLEWLTPARREVLVAELAK